MVTKLFTRRLGPVGMALTAWDIWRRIPAQHRREIMREARKHGPRLANEVFRRRRARRAAKMGRR